MLTQMLMMKTGEYDRIQFTCIHVVKNSTNQQIFSKKQMKQQSIKRKKEHISSVNTNKYEKQQKNE